MARWILLRHARASHAAQGADMDRPLTGEGRRDAAAVGRWLQEQGWLPDRVLCSPAARTTETFSLASSQWRTAPAPTLLRDLYSATAAEYDALLKGEGTIMLVGHNPTMGDFVADHAPEAPRMQPGTVACFEDGVWVTSHQP